MCIAGWSKTSSEDMTSMIYRNRNFSEGSTANFQAADGDSFINCNFSRKRPNTAILVGLTGLSFEGCNLTNCVVPAGSVVAGCNQTQISLCTNLTPDLVTRYGLTACPENCEHVVSTDTITIDGEVQTIYHYKDTVL